MFEQLVVHKLYCFLDVYSGYNWIPIAFEDMEKTMFTCHFSNFAYCRMLIGLRNAPTMFQRFMVSNFSNMVE